MSRSSHRKTPRLRTVGKKPAYPKPGTGEDFPAHRPGTKTGETRSGGKVLQSTRASQARRVAAGKKYKPFTHPDRYNRFLRQLPPARPRKKGEPFRATVPRPAYPNRESTGYKGGRTWRA